METTANVLIVDDERVVRELFQELLTKLGYKSYIAVDGLKALESVKENPIDIILMDVQMPQLDGLHTLEQLKADPHDCHIPVIMVSGYDDRDLVLRCLELGADDYLTKPFSIQIIKARLDGSLRKKRLYDQEIKYRDLIEKYNDKLEERVREQMERTSEAQMGTIFALSKLAEARDPETGKHVERLQLYPRVLCEELASTAEMRDSVTASFIENCIAASPLHDIGKVGIPDAVLLKPGNLTEEEFDIVKKHTLIGANTLRAVDRRHSGNAFLQFGIEIAESHHERWDGRGYPHGLAGRDIPLSARILALPDVYDSLTSKRCYKEAIGHEEAVEMIRLGRENHFDPLIVDAFLAVQDEFARIRTENEDAAEDLPYLYELHHGM